MRCPVPAECHRGPHERSRGPRSSTVLYLDETPGNHERCQKRVIDEQVCNLQNSGVWRRSAYRDWCLQKPLCADPVMTRPGFRLCSSAAMSSKDIGRSTRSGTVTGWPDKSLPIGP